MDSIPQRPFPASPNRTGDGFVLISPPQSELIPARMAAYTDPSESSGLAREDGQQATRGAENISGKPTPFAYQSASGPTRSSFGQTPLAPMNPNATQPCRAQPQTSPGSRMVSITIRELRVSCQHPKGLPEAFLRGARPPKRPRTLALWAAPPIHTPLGGYIDLVRVKTSITQPKELLSRLDRVEGELTADQHQQRRRLACGCSTGTRPNHRPRSREPRTPS